MKQEPTGVRREPRWRSPAVHGGEDVKMATLALASIAARWRLEIPVEARVRPVLRTFLAPRGLRATVRAR